MGVLEVDDDLQSNHDHCCLVAEVRDAVLSYLVSLICGRVVGEEDGDYDEDEED